MKAQLPRLGADFLALAELLKNPDKVEQVGKDIDARAQNLYKAAEANAISLEQRNAAEAALSEARDLIAQANQAKKDAEEALAEAQYQRQAQALEKADMKAYQERLIAQEQALMDRERTLDALAAELRNKEQQLTERDAELARALEAATAEHRRWEQRNVQLNELQDKIKKI